MRAGSSEKTGGAWNKMEAKVRAANRCTERGPNARIGFFNIILSFHGLCDCGEMPVLMKHTRVSHDNSRETVEVHRTWREISVQSKTV